MDSELPEGHQPQFFDKPATEALTSIHGAYTLHTPHEPDTNEVDDLMVRRFLHTLAEISLAVASRRMKT